MCCAVPEGVGCETRRDWFHVARRNLRTQVAETAVIRRGGMPMPLCCIP
jgi:hypothetical protein